MKHKIYWQVVTYPNGKQQSAVIEDSYQTVQFHGITLNGNPIYFDDESKHVSTWCYEQGLKYEEGEMEIELPVKV